MADLTPEQAAANVEMIVALAKGKITHREALGVSGEQMIAIAELGQKLLAEESYEDAKDIFDGLVALDSNVAYFYQGLGTALSNLGNNKEAVEAFKRALELDPEDTTAHYNLATVYIAENKKADAKKLLEKAKKVDPKAAQPTASVISQLWETHFS